MSRRFVAATGVVAILSVGVAVHSAAAATPRFDFSRPTVVATGLEVPWGM